MGPPVCGSRQDSPRQNWSGPLLIHESQRQSERPWIDEKRDFYVMIGKVVHVLTPIVGFLLEIDVERSLVRFGVEGYAIVRDGNLFAQRAPVMFHVGIYQWCHLVRCFLKNRSQNVVASLLRQRVVGWHKPDFSGYLNGEV